MVLWGITFTKINRINPWYNVFIFLMNDKLQVSLNHLFSYQSHLKGILTH